MPDAGRDDRLPIGDPLRLLIGADPADRFDAALLRLGIRGRFGIAVSGGPDSVALLLLCAASPLPGRFAVATVDHGLRPESAGEAAQVAGLCGRMGVPHTILRVLVGPGHGGPQAAARDARYAALADWCPGGWLLTAHHRDDVAETLLMRLARGSGVRGLARMRETAPLRRDGPVLARPLLDWSRADLLGICARVGVTTIRDPSNDDPRFDRTAARTVLATSPGLDPRRLARSATNLADADAALEWAAARLWDSHVAERADGGVDVDPRGLPHDIRRRLVDRVVRMLAGDDRDRAIETLVRMLDAGEHGMIGDIAAVPGPIWTFRRAPPRRPSRSALFHCH